MDSSNQLIKIVACDGSVAMVDRKLAEMSMTIKHQLEEIKGNEVHLSEINGQILQKIVAFLEHYEKGFPVIAEQKKYTSDYLTDWDKSFISSMMDGTYEELKMLFEITKAANYLDIKYLLDICCASIANEIKSKTPEEVKTKFSMTADSQLASGAC